MEQDTYTAPSTWQRSNDCEPLFEAAHLSIYRENTFRITGLSIDASEREIKKQAAKLKMLEELGQGGDAATHPYALRPAPSVDQIRAAMQRLKEPEQRLIDEFFWFWPEEFGKSGQDAALQALQRGDATAAHELWSNAAVDPRTGYVAIHNLAVLYHLVALDWTLEDLTATVDSEREAKIEQYWRTAFHYWEQLATHDDIWDVLKARVQALDDARLTTGFVRRMRASLPEAFDKINAEAALRFAEADRMDWAQKHIDFMNETHQGLDDVEKTALLVLTPARKRVKHLIQISKDSVLKDPSSGVDAAAALISHSNSLRGLFHLFHGEESHHQTELFDEVAAEINICVVQHGASTGLNGENINLLEHALNFATAGHLRELISKNIAIRHENARLARVEPHYKKLDAIEASDVGASQRLALIHSEIVPVINSLRSTDEDAEAADELAEATAGVLRGISIHAYNEEDDFDTALGAVQLAIALTNDSKFSAQLQKDREAVQETLNAVQSDKIELFIRNERIAITRKAFTYCNTTVSLSDIDSFALTVANVYDIIDGKRGYEIMLFGPTLSGGTLVIRCKRFMRSESQAHADFTAIAQGLVRFLAPKIIKRIVADVRAGKSERIGQCLISLEGVKILPEGKGSHKDSERQPYTPWKDLTCIVADGQVAVFDRAAISNTPADAAKRLRANQALLSGRGVAMGFGSPNAILLDGVIKSMGGKAS